jgi:hypothetical protein
LRAVEADHDHMGDWPDAGEDDNPQDTQPSQQEEASDMIGMETGVEPEDTRAIGNSKVADVVDVEKPETWTRRSMKRTAAAPTLEFGDPGAWHKKLYVRRRWC